MGFPRNEGVPDSNPGVGLALYSGIPTPQATRVGVGLVS
jgi:hypothetical protein